MPFNVEDLRRLLSTAIIETNTAPSLSVADQLARTIAPRLAPSLDAMAKPAPADGSLMTAAEALFVRDTIAAELEAIGGGPVAERLIVAGYIDVGPILLRHRMLPAETPQAVGEATGPLQVPGAPSSATETGRIARSLTGRSVLPSSDDDDDLDD
jgi:hypothetical protein